jgi:hypothetical protein
LWGDLPAGFGQPSSGPKLAVKEIFNFIFNVNLKERESVLMVGGFPVTP